MKHRSLKVPPVQRLSSPDLERIKLELLDAYEREAVIDIARWADRFPLYRQELVEYWMWLRGTPRLSDLNEAAPTPSSDQGIAAEVLKRACLAVSLGSEWLEPLANPDLAIQDELGQELENLRAAPRNSSVRAPKAFRRAAVYAWTAAVFGGKREFVSRFAVQKITYVLEHAMRLELFEGHTRKPYGPYDHDARYRDAEPIAKKKGWIIVDGKDISLGPQADQIEVYARRYVRSPELAKKLMEFLGSLSDSELEALATIHWAARAQSRNAQPLTPATIRTYLAESPEWRGKLKRSSFSDDQITRILSLLSRLRLLK